MLALGTGMTVLIVTLGVGLGFAGGWFGFRWRHKGRVFSESDREYFQNLLYRAETAEGKLEQMEPELARTSDRANILEDSHRVIQEELANERQFTLSLNGELARLAKRIDKNTQTLAESLPATRDAGEPTFTAASHRGRSHFHQGPLIFF